MRKATKRKVTLYCDLCGSFIAEGKDDHAIDYCRHTALTGWRMYREQVPYFDVEGNILGYERKERSRAINSLEICDRCLDRLYKQAEETKANLSKVKRPKTIY